jgi:hypothetical protein
VAFESVPLDDGPEDGQEPASVVIVAVDGHLGVATRDHVIEDACSEDAKGPGHAAPWIKGRSRDVRTEFREVFESVGETRQNAPRGRTSAMEDSAIAPIPHAAIASMPHGAA